MAEEQVLHDSQGLRIHINPKNKFCIVRLHYTADPAKRGEAWRAEAKSGLTDAQWAKEMELDWTAQYGEKVFPEIINRRDEIVVKPHEIGADQVCWAGFDYGMRNPSAMIVYTIEDGVMYAIWELYKPCKNIPLFAEEMKACPYWGQIKYIANDPDMMRNKTHDKWGNPTSVQNLFNLAGVTRFLPGLQDEQAWVAMMKEHWAGASPTFRMFEGCQKLREEFESAVYATMSDRLLATQNYRETITERNNHALDACKYFMLSRPREKKQGEEPLKIPNYALMWRH